MAGRERNPERSRERLLDAALEEFAANGFAGARVAAIARRAGLNKQLISHHFGGKVALYQAVMAKRRMRGGGEITDAPVGLPDALGSFYDRARNDPQWIRVLLWESLETADDRVEVAGVDERRARYGERVAWVAEEQAAGRLPAELEPDLLFLTLMGGALYPVLLPEVCRLVAGGEPSDEEFSARYREHLRRFVGYLGAPLTSPSVAANPS